MRGLIALLLLCPSPLLAQDAVPAVVPAVMLAETNVALGLQDTRLTVPVSVAGAGPYAFIIDTGAERTVVSRELAKMLGLVRGPTVRMTAMTGTSIVETVVVPSLSLSNVTSQRIEAPALGESNLGAPGMLGIDALQRQIVAIDFTTNTLTIRPSTKHDRGHFAPGDIVVRARNLLGQLIVTDARFRGKTVRVVIDTGAAVSIGNHALRSRIGELRSPQLIGLQSVTGARYTADYTQLPRFELGGIAFNNLPVAFHEAAPFAKFGLSDQPALLLGMDALRLFRHVEIDFANREVRFSGRLGTP